MLQVAVASCCCCCCCCSCVGFTVWFALLGKQQFYIAEMREYIEEHQLSSAQLAKLLTHRHNLFAYYINFFSGFVERVKKNNKHLTNDVSNANAKRSEFLRRFI